MHMFWIELKGKSSEDAISIHVKDNPNKKNVIQAILEANLTSLTQNQVLHFIQGVNLLLKTEENEPKVKILNIIQQQHTSTYISVIKVEKFYSVSVKIEILQTYIKTNILKEFFDSLWDKLVSKIDNFQFSR